MDGCLSGKPRCAKTTVVVGDSVNIGGSNAAGARVRIERPKLRPGPKRFFTGRQLVGS